MIQNYADILGGLRRYFDRTGRITLFAAVDPRHDDLRLPLGHVGHAEFPVACGVQRNGPGGPLPRTGKGHDGGDIVGIIVYLLPVPVKDIEINHSAGSHGRQFIGSKRNPRSRRYIRSERHLNELPHDQLAQRDWLPILIEQRRVGNIYGDHPCTSQNRDCIGEG